MLHPRSTNLPAVQAVYMQNTFKLLTTPQEGGADDQELERILEVVGLRLISSTTVHHINVHEARTPSICVTLGVDHAAATLPSPAVP